MFTRVFATFIGLLRDNEACVTPKENKKSSVGLLLWKLNLFKVALVYSQKSLNISLLQRQSSEHIKETQGKDFL